MRASLTVTVALLLASLSVQNARATDEGEISLFDGSGKAVAYIAADDEMTIYLWSGKPVAYLERSDDVFNVYGFNGEHLGWFSDGVVWARDGNAACGIKDVMRSTSFEPFKSFKQFKPFKSFKKFAPAAPSFSGKFGGLPCSLLLASGAR